MVEFVGLVKVNVVKGTNLAIRDIVTSDPYVILSLGNQVSFLFMSHLLIWFARAVNIQRSHAFTHSRSQHIGGRRVKDHTI